MTSLEEDNAMPRGCETGSYKAYQEGIAVARDMPASQMALGRKLAVVFFDEHNPKEAVVVAVYT